MLFEQKKLSEEDAFKLEQAKQEEAHNLANFLAPGNAEVSTPGPSPLAEVVAEIMSHQWVDEDVLSAQDLEKDKPKRSENKSLTPSHDVKFQTGTVNEAPDDAGPSVQIGMPEAAPKDLFGTELGGGGGGGGDAGGEAGGGEDFSGGTYDVGGFEGGGGGGFSGGGGGGGGGGDVSGGD